MCCKFINDNTRIACEPDQEESSAKSSKEKKEDRKSKGTNEATHSNKIKNECKRYWSKISRARVETSAEIIKQECEGDDKMKEAVEWMEKRGSKGKKEAEHFYKGAQFSKVEIRFAGNKCKKEEGNPKGEEGYYFLERNERQKESRRKQGRKWRSRHKLCKHME